MKLSEKSKQNYAHFLRQQLIRRNPEHTARITALSDERILELDQQHTALRIRAIRAKRQPRCAPDANTLMQRPVEYVRNTR